MTKHDAVKEYFEPKAEELAGELSFNFVPADAYKISIVTEYSDRLRKRYRLGAEKEYGFAVILTRPYSTEGDDDLNLQAMNFAQGFMDWVDAQDGLRNYPAFPEGCQVKKMECLQNMPNLSEVDPEEGIARYMIQIRIVYFEF